MSFYQRRLPHWDVIGIPTFVTFRLFGSLPAGSAFPPPNLRSGRAFVALDRALDNATSGPLYLRMPEIAGVVVRALRDGEARFSRYKLHAFAVMPNHVYMLLTPACNARQWLGPLKGFTGHKACEILNRHGEPFWQDESYDHLVRSAGEFERIARYIEAKPVKAGLVPEPSKYQWSSAALPI